MAQAALETIDLTDDAVKEEKEEKEEKQGKPFLSYNHSIDFTWKQFKSFYLGVKQVFLLTIYWKFRGRLTKRYLLTFRDRDMSGHGDDDIIIHLFCFILVAFYSNVSVTYLNFFNFKIFENSGNLIFVLFYSNVNKRMEIKVWGEWIQKIENFGI